MTKAPFLLMLAIIGFSSCTSDPENPQLNLASNIVGLDVTLTGNAFDADGAIAKIIIDSKYGNVRID